MKTIIDGVIGLFDSHPFLWGLSFGLVWIGGGILEYQVHRNKQVTLGWFILYLCALIFWVSSAEQLGIIRWGLDFVVLILGWAGIKAFLKYAATHEQE